jgi:hypothetical protein
MRRSLAALILSLIPGAALAQNTTATATWFYKYPLDATTMTYCKVVGNNGDPFGPAIQAQYAIKTTGSSTSVTEATASTNPFTGLAQGDVIVVQRPDGTTDTRVIVTYTNAANVVVDTAVDWSTGFFFRYYRQICGTGATDGWISVGGYADKNMVFSIEQMNVVGGIDVRWECKGDSIASNPVIVYPTTASTCPGGTLGTNVCNYTTAGITSRLGVVAYEPWTACRIGVLIHTSDDGGDTGVNEEQINGYVILRNR